MNACIKRHLRLKDMWIVVITKDAEGFKKKMLSGAPTAITYAGPQPKEVIEEDKAISTLPIPVAEQNIKIININEVLE